MTKTTPPVDFDENPEWTADTQARARPAGEIHPAHVVAALVRKPGRPRGALSSQKALISLRIDQDTLERFKAAGPGWQTRINDVLREAAGL